LKREALHGISNQYFRDQVERVITTPVSAILKQKITIILLAIVIMEISFSASVILVPFVISELGAGEIGIIIFAYYVCTLTASYFGFLCDRYGRKKLLVFGSFLAGLTFVIFPYSENFLLLATINSLKGLASAAIGTAVMAILADAAPPGKNGEYMGKFYLARSAGGGIGFVAGGFFWDIFARNSFLFFSTIVFIVCSVFLAMGEPRPVNLRIQRFTDFWNVEHGAEDEIEMNPLVMLVDSFKDREFRKFSIAWLFFSSIVGVALTYSVDIIDTISEEVGVIEGAEGTFLGIVFLLVAGLVGISQPYFGRASDIYGRKAFLLLGTTATALLATILTPIVTVPENLGILLADPFSLTTVIVLNLGFDIPIPSLWVIAILAILVFCASSFTSSSLGMLTDVTKENERGKAMGIIQTLLSSGSMIGILLGGFALEYFNVLGVLVLCFGFAMLITIIVLSQIDLRNVYLVAKRQ
jgi:MFS family permease